MASDFVRTNIPNPDKHRMYGTLHGRVKLHGKTVRESFNTTNQRVAQQKLAGWLSSKGGVKRTKQGTLNLSIRRAQKVTA